MPADAGRPQHDGGDALGIGDDLQAALLADDHEIGADALVELMPGAVPAADLLVGDQLQADRACAVLAPAAGGLLAEDLGEHEGRDLHVVGAARVQPVTFDPRLEQLLGRWHDIDVPVQDHVEVRSLETRVEQRAGLVA